MNHDDRNSQSLYHRACKNKITTKEAEVQVDLCGHGTMDDKSGQDKDNSMEAILLTTQLKEEVIL